MEKVLPQMTQVKVSLGLCAQSAQNVHEPRFSISASQTLHFIPFHA